MRPGSGFLQQWCSGSPHPKPEATAAIGDRLMAHYGSLHMALRATQEPKMQEHQCLVDNARKYLKTNPELRGDDAELLQLGAITRYRGGYPGTFRVRGRPRNPADRNFIMNKLWPKAQQGKMPLCAGGGIPLESQFTASPSTTVAKKLPDRTISSDKRVILDVRRVHLKCTKTDYWELLTLTL